MTRMRNVPPIAECWTRRSVYDLDEVGGTDVMGLQDLVACRKTRRDKDWPMVRRLADASYLDPSEARERAADEAYWRPLLTELETLCHAARRAPPQGDSA